MPNRLFDNLMTALAVAGLLVVVSCDEDKDDGGKSVSCDTGTHNEYDLCIADGDVISVPGGSFSMGIDGGGNNPAHSITMSAFTIDKFEVTVREYLACVDKGVCTWPMDTVSYSGRTDYFTNEAYHNHPMIYVNWQQATDYCAGLGMSLPTEAQWEFAARGDDGRVYPWGSNQPTSSLTNHDGGYYGDTEAVGTYPDGASPFGLMDMAGNVLEWVADFYSYGYYDQSPASDPPGPESGVNRVTRGGSFLSEWEQVQSVYRIGYHPMDAYSTIGFRCAATGT